MKLSFPFLPRRLSGFCLALGLTALALTTADLAVPRTADAQSCDRSGCGRAACATPARPVPEDRWGELQPVDVTLPLCTPQGPAFCRDSTAFNEFQQSYQSFPWFMSLDVENGFLFTGLSHGLQIWDARSTPENPNPLSQLSFLSIPVWADNAEVKWPLQDVDAPPSNDQVVALSGVSGIGLVVVDTSDKNDPKVVYQSHKKEGEQVYSATINGRAYAFLAASSGSPTGGLFAYDMTRALQLDGCVESAPADPVQCSGVFLGKVGSHGSAAFVDGVDRFVAVSFGASRGFEIWDMGTPASPQLKLSGLGDRSVEGIALWRELDHYYLALRSSFFNAALGRVVNNTSIYDVSCIASGGCPSLGNPLWTAEFNGQGRAFLTFSRSGARAFLYLGTDNRCTGGDQHEWLLDVNDPAAPRDITPPTGYWGWYYRGGPTGFNLVMPRVGKFFGDTFYRAALSILDFHQRTANTGGPRPVVAINGPLSGPVGQALTFTAAATGCTPDPTGWTWSTAGATVSGPSNTSSINLTWTGTGDKTISARNSACGSSVASRTVAVSNSPTGGDALVARFSFSPTSPLPGQTVSFDARSSGGNPTQFVWDFGDGTAGVGSTAAHTYAAPGNYTVRLTASRPGTGTGCVSGTCFADSFAVVAVGDGSLPVNGSFTSSASCTVVFGFDQCQTAAGTAVTLTAIETNATSYQWTFGDGSTATGRTVTHTWAAAGDYSVILTVTRDAQTASSSKLFRVTGGTGPGPGPEVATYLLPLVAQTQGGLLQTSDLYVHNPGSAPMDITLEFRKRGAPENPPPRVTRTIASGATLFLPDVLADTFNRPNSSGFLLIEVNGGNAAPVITSFNTTFGTGGARFGQTIPALALGGSIVELQSLVGLNDGTERLAYFGVVNPNVTPATYRLHFFNSAGTEIHTSADLTIAAFSQRQFQAQEIRDTFGVSGNDYRVLVQTLSGGPLFPYGSNLRLATQDPSFVEAAVEQGTRGYLLGVLNTPGLEGSLFRTDVVLAHPGAGATQVGISYQNVGPASQTTNAIQETLAAGTTRRLTNILQSRFGVQNAVGVLIFQAATGGTLPIVQGESYDDARPARRFGQSMTLLTDADAAGPAQSQRLVGLRQDASYRTTYWVYNPSLTETASFDLIYLGLDGTELGRIANVTLGPGKARQVRPSDHPLPNGRAEDGFTVNAAVRSGRLLAAGQVVQNQTNDPAYIKGVKR
ncbi:MAG TPA: PKD domain-containing protein [Thermoanaerobaculia bacterium]|nr:PKD domain-containing protein [Thermoanaerobaculia bacterium]